MSGRQRKRDRLLITALSGGLLFYLAGRAMGLGRRARRRRLSDESA